MVGLVEHDVHRKQLRRPAGARTGLASVITGALLLLCMFIAPIAGVFPTDATAAALVTVGVMMFSLVRDLRWDNTPPLATFATIM